MWSGCNLPRTLLQCGTPTPTCFHIALGKGFLDGDYGAGRDGEGSGSISVRDMATTNSNKTSLIPI